MEYALAYCELLVDRDGGREVISDSCKITFDNANKMLKVHFPQYNPRRYEEFMYSTKLQNGEVDWEPFP